MSIKIKEARKKAGLTQKELGKKLGISQAAVGQFEKDNSNPKLETIRKIAGALELSVYDLIEGGFGALDPVLPKHMQGANLDGAKVDENFMNVLLSNLLHIDKSSSEYNRTRDNVIALAVSSGLEEYVLSKLKDTDAEYTNLLSSNEKSCKINKLFDSLNTYGQDKAIEQVELLTKIDEYKNKED